MQRGAFCFWLVAAIGVSARPAQAASAPESEEAKRTLLYDGPESCPSEEEVGRILGERGGSWNLRRSGAEDVDASSLRIHREGDVFVGILRVSQEHGTTVRHVQSASCGLVVEALALVLSLVEDDPPTDRSPVPAPEAMGRVPGPDSVVPDSKPQAFTPRSRASISIRGGMTSAASSAAPQGEIGGEIELSALGLRPSLRLGLGVAHSSSDVGGTDGVAFTWGIFLSEVCPHTFRLLRQGSVSVCARLDVGVVRAESRGFVDARTRIRPWGSAGVVARARWNFTPTVFGELAGGPLLPMWREDFALDHRDVVYRAPVVSLLATAGVGVTF